MLPLADVEPAESHGVRYYAGETGARSVGVMDVDSVAEVPVLLPDGQLRPEAEVRANGHGVDLAAVDDNVVVDVDNGDLVQAGTAVEGVAEAAAENRAPQRNADGCMVALPRARAATGIPAAEHIGPGSCAVEGREAVVVVGATECKMSAASGLC